jgi:hypothetical protein
MSEKGKIPYKEAEYKETSFNCPFCKAYSKQDWMATYRNAYRGFSQIEDLDVCFCSHCERYSAWHDEIMIYPDFEGVEPPNEDLDEEIRCDYEEAASILQKSPRGAAALLRLALQKLCMQLGEKGKNIDNDIASLVTKGLPIKVQEALDSLRVIGNESVHPGQMDLKDDVETASALFKLINFIAEKMITEPKEVGEIFASIPESKKEQINKRDKKDENEK